MNIFNNTLKVNQIKCTDSKKLDSELIQFTSWNNLKRLQKKLMKKV